jgi:hypothetical protein
MIAFTAVPSTICQSPLTNSIGGGAEEAEMRKIIIATTLGLIAVGMTLAPVSVRTIQAEAEGSGTDVRANSRIAMIDHASTPVALADARLALHATNLMVAEAAEGSATDVHPVRVAMMLYPPADTGRG